MSFDKSFSLKDLQAFGTISADVPLFGTQTTKFVMLFDLKRSSKGDTVCKVKDITLKDSPAALQLLSGVLVNDTTKQLLGEKIAEAIDPKLDSILGGESSEEDED
eukprot:TRINITY_DN31968_c0_g1_i1.p1 TRINITY_DN31968_c0_g1~~TRINITY_DN31968_c0_g1_i1.p1  ORF type:complete len:105 (-),score=31.20 TRINITY_DN31968_c0_g1_i1:319-633(-)